MRRAAPSIALALILGTGAAASSAARAADAGDALTVAATKFNEAAVDQVDAARPGETWRYRRHGGLWWYWLPSEKWAYWTGDRWAGYEARAYSEFRAARSQRNYSYPADQGNWGPVRYNGYGQPQYPYSQRKSGLRQLGPVPAMGGVRSLPGWGGER